MNRNTIPLGRINDRVDDSKWAESCPRVRKRAPDGSGGPDRCVNMGFDHFK